MVWLCIYARLGQFNLSWNFDYLLGCMQRMDSFSERNTRKDGTNVRRVFFKKYVQIS